MTKKFKTLVALTFAAVLTGCATHANIEMPLVSNSGMEAYAGKSISYEVLYTQPTPGSFGAGGKQQDMKSVDQVQLSVASARVLHKMPSYITGQLPASAKQVENGEPSDLSLVIAMEARNKLGPAYADHQFAKTFGKNMLTFGLGPADYKIIADFDVEYSLLQDGQLLHKKAFQVKDSINHQRGDFEAYNSLDEYSGQMLEKHMVLTLNDFLKEAAKTVPAQ